MASRNKSSVIALMFYDGKYALLSIVPRGDEHHRHRKQYAIRFDGERYIRV